MGELHIDIAEFEVLSRALIQLADQSAASAAQVAQASRTAGACWGNDAPGKQFAQTYVPDASEALSYARGLAEQLRVFGNNVAVAARNLAAQDTDNAAVITRAGGNTAVAGGAGVAPLSDVRIPGGLEDEVDTGTLVVDPEVNSEPQASSGIGVDGQAGGVGATPNPTEPTIPAPTPVQPGVSMPAQSSPSPAYVPGDAGASPAPAPMSAGADSAGPTAGSRDTGPQRGGGSPASLPGSGSAPAAEGGEPESSSTATESAGPASRVVAPQVSTAPSVGGSIRSDGQEEAQRGVSNGARREKKNVAEELAQRYGLDLSGWDLPGADESASAEIASAVDAILGRYRFVALRRVTVAPLPVGEWSRVSWVRDEHGTPLADEMIVSAATVLDPEGFAEQVSEAVEHGYVTPVSLRRPVYSTTLRAMGSVVDVAGGFAARVTAQREMLAAYLGMTGRSRALGARRPEQDSLARVVGGFRDWRALLSGCCFHQGRFHPGPALAEAFTEVEMVAHTADVPASVLHALLLGAARDRRLQVLGGEMGGTGTSIG